MSGENQCSRSSRRMLPPKTKVLSLSGHPHTPSPPPSTKEMNLGVNPNLHQPIAQTTNLTKFHVWVSATLFCLSPLLHRVAGDSFQNYELSTGCFAVTSTNHRTHSSVKCKNTFSLATFDSTQQMDDLGTVLTYQTQYHVAVTSSSGKTHF